ncbi:multiple inositol polyphosphate phosphatase 1 [Acyrthosiphon pisum]|uniref:Multiple inositol polyphosphate phosphatase 1 n=1 Tax=Acyrthosiphon pisum TaxID=7029 RepID=A0A8R2B557_ACYPI|nr:multiple inositol polyphosphate phosphatase 1 [Acyrthosiphon pisum]XP_008182158.1 multiple inositol polyphosphate phosphatase 1 [Acyrthosiphon pisum]XP_008182159.1 multiple inositol polyphosphate phosphatase 1 [Acyrthosiphon pisum]|eukprot:XP_008182157.1 PREDICTED: multiple inositol polyphosphate phosphatase 1 isoform X1 [Acyrthosiphon pisum]
MLALVTAILCSSIGHIHSEDQCNGLYSDYSHHLSSKTPYRYVANHDIEPVNFEGCKAWKIWLVQRHGTRTPGKELDQFVKNRLPEIQKDIVNNLIEHKLCNEDEIKLWTSHEEIDDKKRLTKEGEDELLALAERMQLRFPNLLNQPYESTNFLFRFTDTQRTRISAKQFATGLFGRNDVKKVLFDEPLAKDPLLRFYKVCQKWRKDVKKSSTASAEHQQFIESELTNVTLKSISSRLGLGYTLTFKDAKNIYTYCAFETAWEKNKVSPWCSIFNKSDFMLFEYSEDLKHYLIDGYAYELSYKQACVLLKNAIEYFDDQDLNSKNGIFYFTHSGTILKMLGLLGLYKDEHKLKHDNYFKMENRLWRTSKIDPFGSNIAFVLYKCNNNETKILTLHQERIVHINGCKDDLCSYEKFKQLFATELKNCNFDEMCNID